MTDTRLCLITPPGAIDGFDEALDSALATGKITSLLIAEGPEQARLTAFVAIAAAHDVAAILTFDREPATGHGVQIDTGLADLKTARADFGGRLIVGAGGIRSRHDAMTFGEVLPDYLFFGRIDGDDEPGIHSKALGLAAWWAELFQIPAIVMGGNSIASVATAAAADIEFVALRRAVWDHPSGSAEAVTQAAAILTGKARE